MEEETSKKSKIKKLRSMLATGVLSLGILSSPGLVNEVYATETPHQEVTINKDMYDLKSILESEPNLMLTKMFSSVAPQRQNYKNGTLSYSVMRERYLKSGWDKNLEDKYLNILGERKKIEKEMIELQEKKLSEVNISKDNLKKYENKSLETVKKELEKSLNGIINKDSFSFAEGNDWDRIYLLKDKIDKLSNKDIAQNASKLEMAIQKSGEILRNKKGITSKDIKLNELHQKHREIKQEILEKMNNKPRGLVRRDSPYAKELTNLMQKQGIIEAEISLRDMQIESEVVNRVYSKENKQNSFRESLKVNQENGWYIASVEDNNGRENSIKEKDGWHIAPVEGNQTKNENSIDKENGWHKFLIENNQIEDDGFER